MTINSDIGDWQAMREVRRGNLVGFEAFCLRVEGSLLGYLRHLIQNQQEAEDLAQEALFRLYTLAVEGRIRPSKGSPSALLFSIAHNLAIDSHRRNEKVAILEPRSAAHPSPVVEQSLLRDQIALALAKLPENHRNAILQREFGGLSYKEIAQSLGSSLNEVKVWIHRARTRLAELLDRDGQYIGERQHEL